MMTSESSSPFDFLPDEIVLRIIKESVPITTSWVQPYDNDFLLDVIAKISQRFRDGT